ncbi:uncharacterized protein [Eurosta solidaginis]|uniref:uncharacterized protein n=1 Tax=Eurosta solidaginis TaxID=178769 RepID=UPI0035309A77
MKLLKKSTEDNDSGQAGQAESGATRPMSVDSQDCLDVNSRLQDSFDDQIPSSVKDVILNDEQVDSDVSEYDSDEDPDHNVMKKMYSILILKLTELYFFRKF